MQPNFILESYGPFVKIIGNNANGQIVKHTTAEEAIKLFQIDDNEKVFQSPFFPFWNVIYKIQGDNYFLINVEPLGVFNYTVHVNSDYIRYSFHIPYLYFFWELNYNSLKKDYAKNKLTVFVSYNPPSMDKHIYIPHLNNINKDGDLCLGNVDIKSIFKNFSELKQAQDDWLSATRNRDLVNWEILHKENGKIYTDEISWSQSGLINNRRKTTIREILQNEY